MLLRMPVGVLISDNLSHIEVKVSQLLYMAILWFYQAGQKINVLLLSALSSKHHSKTIERHWSVERSAVAIKSAVNVQVVLQCSKSVAKALLVITQVQWFKNGLHHMPRFCKYKYRSLRNERLLTKERPPPTFGSISRIKFTRMSTCTGAKRLQPSCRSPSCGWISA